MEHLSNTKKFDSTEDEIDSHVESYNASECCEQTLTRSSSSASSSSSTGCVFEGNEILGEDAPPTSPSGSGHHSCAVDAALVDQTNWAEYLTLGVGEYNNYSHDDSGFRTETDESLCRTVSSCDLDFQEAGPAPRRPQALNTVHKPHTEKSTSTSTQPESTNSKESPEKSSSGAVCDVSSQAPVVLVENLDTPSSTSSCDDAMIANGQCSSGSHSCSSSRDSGLSSMAELEASSSNTSNAKVSPNTEIKSDKPDNVAACCSSKVTKATNSDSIQKTSTSEVHHLTAPIRSIPCAIGRVLEHDALALSGGSVMSRLRPPVHAPGTNVGCSSNQQFSICSGSCCNSECSASLG